MELTYYGHSCFSVEAGGKKLLFDPFITPNELASHIDVDTIEADYIFVSHAHFDHITDVERIARRTGAKVLACWELYQWFTRLGLQNVHPINPGGKFAFDFGTVKAVAAQHSASLPDGSYGGIACGFVIEAVNGTFYYSGDTALTYDIALIPKFFKLDFAVFPIGDGLTMGIEEAIEAAKFTAVTSVVGVHYDTFGFIRIGKDEAIKNFESAGLTLLMPGIGQSITI